MKRRDLERHLRAHGVRPLTVFVLDAERWSRFVEIVDRPAQDSAGLD